MKCACHHRVGRRIFSRNRAYAWLSNLADSWSGTRPERAFGAKSGCGLVRSKPNFKVGTCSVRQALAPIQKAFWRQSSDEADSS